MTVSEPNSIESGDVQEGSTMEAFSALAKAWELTTDEQINLLGSPGRSTYFKWRKKGGNLPPDTMERISHLTSIYKALEIVFTDPKSSDGWLRRENDYFKKHAEKGTALDVMLGGRVADIYRVRQYLDAQRGG